MHVILKLAKKYPQILLPVQKGMRDTEEYRNVCLRGAECKLIPDFSYNDNDVLEIIETQAGDAEVISLADRKDFIHMVQCLAYKCEPVEVTDSIGAMTIKGLNNWEKVRAGDAEYKDMIIILSLGIYSNVSAADVEKATSGRIVLSEEEWISKSVTIRKYHELRHFVDRRLRPADIDALRDEVNGDRDGIIAAFGYYDRDLAKLFLGIEGTEYRQGGRLQNYLPEGEKLEDFMNRALELIEGSRL